MIAKKNAEVPQQASNRILQGTEITGDIRSNGDFRIDGIVKGNIHIEGKLVVGEKGVVEGEMKCSQATISGKAKGTLLVTEILTLSSSSTVEGDIICGKLAVEPGAVLTGTCKMGGSVRELQKTAQHETIEKTA